MKSKNITILLILAVCMIITTLGIANTNVVTQQPLKSGLSSDRRGSIKWFVKRAKEQKKTKVVVPLPEESYAEVTGLDEAVAHFTVFLVEPIEQKTAVLNDSQIITWNKLRVIEFLSSPAKNCLQCVNGLTAPGEMLPLRAGEILVPTSGGSLVVDGVELESRNQDFSETFSPSKKYLVFLSFDPTKAIGKLSLGPYGMFALTGHDRIVPLNRSGAINRDLELKLGNSLIRFKDHLQRRMQ